MCDELDNRSGLHAVGRISARFHLVRGLSNRLLLVEARERRGLRTTPLIPPMVVIGLPRSGTTFLHQVLCHAPDALPLMHWQLHRPLPPVNGPDRRLDQGRKLVEDIRRMAPGIDAKHLLDTEQPEECMLLLDAAMASLTYAILFPVPDYIEWLLKRDGIEDYACWRDSLSIFQQDRPGGRLTLKAPPHTAFVEAIWHHAPEAMLVQSHRDPVKVVGSLCSLLYSLHALVVDDVDRERLGASMLDTVDRLASRSLAARAAHRDKIVVDVPYRRLVADPVKTALEIHEAHGLPITAELERSLAEAVAQRPQHEHGVHEYALSDFGLSEKMVRDRLSGYIDRFLT